MGYYIKCEEPRHKASQLIANHGAEMISQPKAFSEVPEGKALICVVENGIFDAAALCYDELEFKDFTWEGDLRSRTWLLMDEAKAHRLARYKPIKHIDPSDNQYK